MPLKYRLDFVLGTRTGCFARFEWYMLRRAEEIWDALPKTSGLRGERRAI
jgi:hypothetical protein